MGRNRRIVTHSAEETLLFGKEFGKALKSGSILCLNGELGSGKTTFVKGIVKGVTTISETYVVSPTYVYLNIYDNVCHFDLYRLQNSDEFLALGFDEYLFSDNISCIEWSERISFLLPKHVYKINFSYFSTNSREIQIFEPSVFNNCC